MNQDDDTPVSILVSRNLVEAAYAMNHGLLRVAASQDPRTEAYKNAIDVGFCAFVDAVEAAIGDTGQLSS